MAVFENVDMQKMLMTEGKRGKKMNEKKKKNTLTLCLLYYARKLVGIKRWFSLMKMTKQKNKK